MELALLWLWLWWFEATIAFLGMWKGLDVIMSLGRGVELLMVHGIDAERRRVRGRGVSAGGRLLEWSTVWRAVVLFHMVTST